MIGFTGQDSALKRARLARNLTLEQAAAQLNRMTGGSTDASALSAWESGRKRTGIGNRRALSQFYRERPEVLFAHQDGRDPAIGLGVMGTDVVVRVLTRYTDLVEAMVEVVSDACEFLVVTGSRSREKAYLASIETTLARQPDLVHYRVLYGPPRHAALSEHLVRLLELRNPGERRNGVKTLHLGIEQLAVRERHFVASESAAVVPLPSFHGAEGFDCGVLMGREAALGLVQHGREACASARPVETVEAVRALPIRHGGASVQGEA